MARLGDFLRRSRGRSGLSQGDVARTMGVERPTVSQWEAGLYRPSLDKLPALVSAYQLTDDERAELSSILLGDSASVGAA